MQIALYDGLEIQREETLSLEQGRMSLLQRAFTTIILGADPYFEDMKDFCLVIANAIAVTYGLISGSPNAED
jgi:hypothetical protein